MLVIALLASGLLLILEHHIEMCLFIGKDSNIDFLIFMSNLLDRLLDYMELVPLIVAIILLIVIPELTGDSWLSFF